jgi:hypothetical protein
VCLLVEAACYRTSFVLCCAGIPEGGAYVHVMYVYRNPSDTNAYDESFEVNFKLPVREED